MSRARLKLAGARLLQASALICVVVVTTTLAIAAPADGAPAMSLSMRGPSALRPVAWPTTLRPIFAWLFAQPDETAPPAPPAPPADVPPPAPEPPAVVEDAQPTDEELVAAAIAEAEAKAGEVIQITGSAIERTETTTAAPVTVLDKAELEAAGMASIGDILQDLPANSNAINTQANNGGDGATRVDIRGLGSSRTLVLVNGRRHVAGGTGADASVDLNSIPLAIIERIEVLKDGASAVYGSDAIGGVVNVITRSNFKGSEVNLYTGTTGRGGGSTYDMSFVTGQDSPRGNVVFSAGFYDQKDVFADQRSFASPQRDVDWACIGDAAITDKAECEFPTGSVGTPEGTIFDIVCDPLLGETPEVNGCAATEADLICPSGICFNDNGTWRDFALTGNSDTGDGDFYNFQPSNYLLTPQRRYNVWSSGNYKLTDHVRSFFEASYVNRTSDQQLAPEPLFTLSEGATVASDSIYNDFGRPLPDVGKRFNVPRATFQDIDTFRLVTGIDGRLPDDLLKGWKWEASYNYGRTVGTVVNRGNLVRPNVVEALGPSYIDGDGNPQCGTPTSPGSDGCVPLDILSGPDSITPDMLGFLTYDGVARGFNKQHTVMAQASGPVVKLPNNGDIVMAFGADYRRESGGFQPDPLTSTGDTTGNKVEPTLGHYGVTGGFAELSIVPVSQQEWAKWLELSAAARVVNYSTFGTNFTWKGGLLYKAPQGIAVRGTVSTAFRAPSVAALYSGQFDDFPQVSDPCDNSMGAPEGIIAANCNADDLTGHTDARSQLPARSGGNPELQPETANVLTAGVVYEPTFAEGLAFTVDYFQIKIDDAIQSAGANILLSNCYAQTDVQADRQDCDKIIRNASGQIIEITDTITNIGSTETSGIDTGIGYTYEVPGAGRFRHDLEGTFLTKYNATIGDIETIGLGYYDLGVFPRFKGNFGTMWNHPGIGVGSGFNIRYIHGFRECENDDCSGEGVDAAPGRRVDANITADLFASYTLKSPAGQSVLSAGINNLLDTDPPTIYNGFLATSDSNSYDYLGRYFYMRMTQAF